MKRPIRRNSRGQRRSRPKKTDLRGGLTGTWRAGGVSPLIVRLIRGLTTMIEVPSHFFAVSYNGDCYPGATGVSGLARGANCQHFAYELLRYFGKKIPDFRSSELWEDEQYTFRVASLEPLDLVLYHSEERAWGAHLGVFLGDDQIIHLSKELNHPVIWTHEHFLRTPRYRCYLGAKRVRDVPTVEAEQGNCPNSRSETT